MQPLRFALLPSVALAALACSSTPDDPATVTWAAAAEEWRPSLVTTWQAQETAPGELRWRALDAAGEEVLAARLRLGGAGAFVLEDEADPALRIEVAGDNVVHNSITGSYLQELVVWSTVDLLEARRAALAAESKAQSAGGLRLASGGIVGPSGDLVADGSTNLLCGEISDKLIASSDRLLRVPAATGDTGATAPASLRPLQAQGELCKTALNLPSVECTLQSAGGGALIVGGGCAAAAAVLNTVTIVGWGTVPVQGGACAIVGVGGAAYGALAALFGASAAPACAANHPARSVDLSRAAATATEADYTAQGIAPAVAASLAKAGRCDPGEYLKRAARVHGSSSICEQPRSCDSWSKPGSPISVDICGTLLERERRNYDCLKARQERDWCFADQPDAQKDEHRRQKSAAEQSAKTCRSVYNSRCRTSSGR